MSPQDWITIGSLFVGALGLAFGMYTHFSTRRSANLTFEVIQLVDYGFPEQFMHSLTNMPIAVIAKNVGNKTAERVGIYINTTGAILNIFIECAEPYEQKMSGFVHAQVRVPSLNPGEVIKIFVQCDKETKNMNYIEKISISHSEGIATERKSLLGKSRLGRA
jgi:hypothetical protein